MSHETARPANRDWVLRISWLAVVAPIPYSLSRVLWAAGVPVGITEEFLRELDSPGWGSLGLLMLARLSEGTAVFTHVFIKARAQVVPGWVPLLGGRAVRPWIVIGLLLPPIVALAGANLDALHEIVVHGEPQRPSGFADEPAWSLWAHQIVFLVWGSSLTVATFAYWRATRPPACSPREHVPARAA
jgi:hypothetical protein